MKNENDPRHQRRKAAVRHLFHWGFQANAQIEHDLASGVILAHKKIDKLIAEAAPEWPIEQINRIDLAVLRLATYELAIKPKEPPKVVIDEAVELAKAYGGEKSPSFVNGVLGTIYKKVVPKEKQREDQAKKEEKEKKEKNDESKQSK